MSGWFAVKRGITQHPIFRGRMDRLGAFIWLVENACWKDTKHDINGTTITVKRGQVCAATRYIALETGMGREQIRGLIKRLEAHQIVTTRATHGKNLITICNYDKYQDTKKDANPSSNPRATHEQPTKEQGNNIPVGAKPKSLKEIVFTDGISMLLNSGVTDRNARSILGKWIKHNGEAEVVTVLGQCQRAGAIDAVAYIEGIFKASGKHNGNATLDPLTGEPMVVRR